MLKKAVQLALLLTGATIGVLVFKLLIGYTPFEDYYIINNDYTFAIIGAILLYVAFFWAVDYAVSFIRYLEERLVKAPVTDIVFGSFGLILGLIVAFLIGIPLKTLSIGFIADILPLILTLLLGYLGFQVGFKKKEEVIGLITFSKIQQKKKNQAENDTENKIVDGATVKILDTSVIIDGRIADILNTGFIEGTIIIPRFVLEELQYIADSSDSLKRNRGRRGLDILNMIQKEEDITVEIYEGDFTDIQEVDSKLVRLAKDTKGMLVTNDFNLNKVSELQGVKVLNINDLANAVKPLVIPGEVMSVMIIKDGKEHNQGVAYLDDGTMIVVEDGRGLNGKVVDVEITSVLQTSAGRMIFAKLKGK